MSKFALLATFLLLSGSAIADIVAPDCMLSWSWTFNSLGQNACTIAAYIQSTCYQGSFTIPSLPPDGYHYLGPTLGVDAGEACKCNTITYNLLSACDACQNSQWITWSEFSSNCTTKLPPSTFPNPVPAGTRVPKWALLDPTRENSWNNVTAYATGDSPELAPGAIIGPLNASSSSYLSGPTSPPASLVPSTSSSPVSSTSSSTSPSPTKRSSSNAGAITGGVVGGIAAISLAVVAVVYFVRQQRPRAPSAPFPIDYPSPRPQIDEVRQSVSTGPSYLPTSGAYTTMRPYDPNDPTTFPGYQRSPLTPTSPAPTYSPTSNLATMQVSRAPGYRGLPTV